MKLFRITFFLMVLSMMLLTSCNKDDSNPVDPNDDGGGGSSTNPSGQPIPALGGNHNGVMATISYEMETIPGFPAVAISLGFAQFGQGVDAGSVTVNGNTLGKTTQGGSTFYITPSPSNPTQMLTGVNFDGSNHSWQVSGGNGIPALNGSVQSPRSFALSSPANNGTVNKANGINVSWNNTTNNNRVLIVLVPLNNSNQYYTAEDLADNGSFTIPTGEISGFSGQAMLQIVKYRYAEVAAGGNNYYIISEVVKSVNLTIN